MSRPSFCWRLTYSCLVVLLVTPPATVEASWSSIMESLGSILSSADVAPRSYRSGRNQKVHIDFDSLYSSRTLMSRDYSGLPFCYYDRNSGSTPSAMQRKKDTVGASGGEKDGASILAKQEQQQKSHYQVLFGTMTTVCQVLCSVKYDDAESVERLKEYIDHGYRHRWSADGLPATTARSFSTHWKDTRDQYTGGFPLGYSVRSGNGTHAEHYVYNHVVIRIYANAQSQISKVSVEPLSVGHRRPSTATTNDDNDDSDDSGDNDSSSSKRRRSSSTASPSLPPWPPTRPEACTAWRPINVNDVADKPQVVRVGEEVLYTYDVVATYANAVRWSERWDALSNPKYQSATYARYRVLFLVKNVVLVILFSIWMVLASARELRRDVEAYRAAAAAEEEEEEGADVKWTTPTKSGVGDDESPDIGGAAAGATGIITSRSSAGLFRPAPLYPMLISALVGSGIQLWVVAILCLALARGGCTGPSRPGSVAYSVVLLFALTGAVAGFVGGRLHVAFAGTHRSILSGAGIVARRLPQSCFRGSPSSG
jgi:Endomembrane protein 70